MHFHKILFFAVLIFAGSTTVLLFFHSALAELTPKLFRESFPVNLSLLCPAYLSLLCPAYSPGYVFDIGFNDGRDTAFYLQSGYKVIAVDANPLLIEAGRKRFSEAIRSRQLALFNYGIRKQNDTQGSFTFYVHRKNNEWSSFIRQVGCRRNDGQTGFWNYTYCDLVEVKALDCGTLISKYLTPLYLKIDIEGFDHFCLQSLAGARLPMYVSVEAQSWAWAECMRDLGYDKFKYVCQSPFHGASGPFGENAVDWISATSWQSYEALHDEWEKSHKKDGTFARCGGWWDFHAKRSDNVLVGSPLR